VIGTLADGEVLVQAAEQHRRRREAVEVLRIKIRSAAVQVKRTLPSPRTVRGVGLDMSHRTSIDPSRPVSFSSSRHPPAGVAGQTGGLRVPGRGESVSSHTR